MQQLKQSGKSFFFQFDKRFLRFLMQAKNIAPVIGCTLKTFLVFDLMKNCVVQLGRMERERERGREKERER